MTWELVYLRRLRDKRLRARDRWRPGSRMYSFVQRHIDRIDAEIAKRKARVHD